MKLFKNFARVAKKFPNNIAMVCENENITYQDSIVKIKQIASVFDGYKKRSVTLFLPKSINLLLFQLAVNRSDNVFTNVDIHTPVRRLENIVNQNESHWIVTATDVDISKFENINMREALRTQYFIVWETDFDRVYEKDVTHIYFSSGSTGEPKGILLNDLPIYSVVRQQAAMLGVNSRSAFAWLLSPSFDASLSDIYLTLLSGATLHICTFDQTKVKTLEKYFNDHAVSHSDLSPSIMHLLNFEKLNTLKGVIFGGEIGNQDVIKRKAKQVMMFNAYGPTEATICTSLKKVDDNWTVENIGKPFKGVEYLIDDDGELHIAGSHLCIRYNKEQINKEKFYTIKRKRFYKTSDIVECINGEFYFKGRKDRQFKKNGILISPEEIEKVAIKCGANMAICKKEQKVTLYYIGELTKEQLKAKMNEYLNENMLPTLFEKRETFEKNINGKIKL